MVVLEYIYLHAPNVLCMQKCIDKKPLAGSETKCQIQSCCKCAKFNVIKINIYNQLREKHYDIVLFLKYLLNTNVKY